MDLQEIQNKLNAFFEVPERKIVFWYDDDAAYEGDVDSLQLSEGVKFFKLNGSNNFEAKLLLEHKDVDSNYLVYAPYARPEDKKNSLVGRQKSVRSFRQNLAMRH